MFQHLNPRRATNSHNSATTQMWQIQHQASPNKHKQTLVTLDLFAICSANWLNCEASALASGCPSLEWQAAVTIYSSILSNQTQRNCSAGRRFFLPVAVIQGFSFAPLVDRFDNYIPLAAVFIDTESLWLMALNFEMFLCFLSCVNVCLSCPSLALVYTYFFSWLLVSSNF